MSKKSFNPDNCIEALNNLKMGIQMRNIPFTKEELITGFRNCGLPSNTNFFTFFKSFGVIQEVSKGKYMFCDKNPIYVGTLRGIKHKYQEQCRKYNYNRKLKSEKVSEQTPEIVHPQVVVNNSEDEIQKAINLLKENGYHVMLPVGILYKTL